MRKSLTYAALIISLLVLFTGKATAGKIHVIHSVCEEYQAASAVFTAYVTDIQRDEPMQLMTVSMQIEESFKGVKESDVIFTQSVIIKDCTYFFYKGDHWLIYAIRDPETHTLHPMECSRSTRVEFAGTDLRYLRALPEIATKTRLAGAIDQYIQEYDGLKYLKHLSDIKVTVTNQKGRHYETYTDMDGVYEFVDLPAGKYKIRAGIPENLKLESSSNNDSEVSLVDQRCAEVGLIVTPVGSISGQVVDEKGKIVSGLKVTVIAADKIVNPGRQGDAIRQDTDGEGHFKIKGLLPGSYLVGVNIDRKPSDPVPFSPTFYPGVANLSQAEKLVLREGEQVTGLTLPLPARIATIVIEGTLVYSDGEVVNQGGGEFANSEAIDSYMAYASGKVDEDGHFSISVLHGTVGWTHATGFKPPKTPGAKIMYIMTIQKVEATEDIKNLKIVIPLPNDK